MLTHSLPYPLPLTELILAKNAKLSLLRFPEALCVYLEEEGSQNKILCIKPCDLISIK